MDFHVGGGAAQRELGDPNELAGGEKPVLASETSPKVGLAEQQKHHSQPQTLGSERATGDWIPQPVTWVELKAGQFRQKHLRAPASIARHAHE